MKNLKRVEIKPKEIVLSVKKRKVVYLGHIIKKNSKTLIEGMDKNLGVDQEYHG